MPDDSKKAGDDLKAGALEYHRLPRPGKLAIVATKPLASQRDLALAYSPGRGRRLRSHRRRSEHRRRGHQPGQPGRRHHQRHGRARPRRHRPAGRQAGDGRQGGPVQEIRRYRRVRHRDQRDRSRQAGRHHRQPGADLRRHQPGRHQGAGMLRGRKQAEGAHEDPGHARRPAWHGDHRRARRC